MYRKLLAILIIVLISGVANASDCADALTQNEERSLKDEFFNANNSGNIEQVKSMLRQYPGLINVQYSLGQTPLIMASVRGNYNLVKTLLDFENNFYEANNFSSSDFENIDPGSIKFPQFVDVDMMDEYGRNALMWASIGGHDKIVELFIDNGPFIMNARDLDGMTALNLATQAGHISTVKILLQSPKTKNLAPLFRLHDLGLKRFTATISNHIDNMIVDINSTDNLGFSPLLHAIINNDIEMVKTLIENDADKQIKHLLSSSEKVSSYVIEALSRTPVLDVNIQLDKDDGVHSTPLMIASGEGYLGIVKLLLDHHKINVNAEDLFGFTPLMYVAISDIEYPEIAEVLLDRADIKVNKVDATNEQTALIYAIKSQHHNIIRLLLSDEDIYVDMADKDDHTALYWAAQLNDYETLELLLDRDEIDTSFIDLSQINHNDIEYFLYRYKHYKKSYIDIVKAWNNKNIDPLTTLVWANKFPNTSQYNEN